MSFLSRLFSIEPSEHDKARYAQTQQELAQARGDFHNTVEVVQSKTRRLKLMEQTLELKGAYGGSDRG